MKVALVAGGVLTAFLIGLLTGWLVFGGAPGSRESAGQDQQLAELKQAVDRLPSEVAASIRKDTGNSTTPVTALPSLQTEDVEESLKEPLRKLDEVLSRVEKQHAAILRLVDAEDARYQQLMLSGMQRLIAGDMAAAETKLTQAVESRPELFNAYALRGSLYLQKQLWAQALADLETARKIEPKAVDALNNEAWIRATCPDEKFRDGSAAVELATQACELSNWKDYARISTLAAAHAERGDFGPAVQRQEESLKLAPEAAKADLTATLELYKRKEPYREKPLAATP